MCEPEDVIPTYFNKQFTVKLTGEDLYICKYGYGYELESILESILEQVGDFESEEETKMAKREKAIVLLSGGIDSAVTLAQAKAMGYDCVVLAFDYGQRHKIELEFASNLAAKFNVPFIKQQISMSGEVPLLDSTTPITDEASCYVPGRNLIFLAYAQILATSAAIRSIFIGANLEDSATFPDCRRPFFDAFEEATCLANPLKSQCVKIQVPFYSTSKKRIVELAKHYKIDLADTWSCYDPKTSGSGTEPCGKCPACVRRAAAIKG